MEEKTNDTKNRIIEIINQIRPYLNNEGGDIEFIKYEEDYVYIKLYGACLLCDFKDYTIQDNIFETIHSEIPTIKGVINIEL